MLAATAARAAPRILRAQEMPKSGTVRVGMQTILSGPIALPGTSQQNAAQTEVERINASGGLAGRKIELVVRDSKGQFFSLFKTFKRDIEVVTQAWPKLGAADFTEVITKLPQALYSLQYAGDLSSFIN